MILAIAVVGHADAALWKDTSLLSSTSDGDTVWFDSPEMPVMSSQVLTPGGLRMTPPMRVATARGRSLRTPVVVLMPEREPMPSLNEVVDRALHHTTLGIKWDDRPDDWGITTLESGQGDYQGRHLYGWDLSFDPDDERTLRVIFVTISLQTALDSLPKDDRSEILQPHFIRPFQIPMADRLRTAKVVGEYRADLKAGRVERVTMPSK